MQEPLLSDLCKICHINPPQYRCPRCSTQTCSLPCTKRHKLWAQCSGVRDPAAYKKKSELVTPSGVDQDYNFLARLERNIEKADREAEGRGIALRPALDGGFKNQKVEPAKGEVQMQNAFQRVGVIINRAPTGMTRSKENSTKWHQKHKCLSWTVEWVHDDGRKELGNCLETLPVSEAYAKLIQENQPASKKRKCRSKSKPAVKAELAAAATEDVGSPTKASAEQATSSHPSQLDFTLPPPAKETTVPPYAAPLAAASHTPSLTANHFYLLRPHTPTASRVLIPLPPVSRLSMSLQNRVVLEFPTIYVLPYPPDALPRQYMLEEQFLGYSEQENKELEALLKEVGMQGEFPTDDGFFRDHEIQKQEKLDDRKILDVLRQDLKGL
ncbi:MAG: hypothetical protein FRX48_08473 [Lasallia pustulata]|uniref:Box C/D snoRNA protein 1 n=1 Tax=Lasallia pustulata TaxID=136370 RepID=A0A5M8PEI6_9LECA|nr:MAG: hypothetical protein FRX48_08473 [Lasallia pustulata]